MAEVADKTHAFCEFEKVHQLFLELDAQQRYGVPLVLGTIARINEQALVNWGIDSSQLKPEELERIRSIAKESYDAEWGANQGKPSPDWISIIAEATDACGLGGLYSTLNTQVGAVAKAFLLGDDKQDEIVVADIGAGTGMTSLALCNHLRFDELSEKIFRRLKLTLIDPSSENCISAQRMIFPHFMGRGNDFRTIIGDDSVGLSGFRDESVDIIISNAVFHHLTHPEYLKRILRVLKPGGAVVSGDYHTSVWQHPYLVCTLLKEMGIAEDVLATMRQGMARTFSVPTITDMYEKQANTEMIRYWAKIVELCRQRHVMPSPMLEGHQTYEQRRRDFESAGFETDEVEILRTTYRGQLQRIKRGETHRDFLLTRPAAGIIGARKWVKPDSGIARVMIAQKRQVA